ncbi:hypothetical protein LXA43DRAFT_359429 [Ganoderma leucocontextum]|nr:hypothetical protein LXA43DRAFT_359429 [Ganoderma leucocontextum]
MSPRNPFDSLPLGHSNIPLSPVLSLEQRGGYESLVSPTDENSSLSCLRKIVRDTTIGTLSGPTRDEADAHIPPTTEAPLTITAARPIPSGSLRFADFDRLPSPSSLSSKDDSDTEAIEESDEYASEESLEDDADDFALRAMAFARMRASSFGLGAAMTGFNNMLLSDDAESEGSSDMINSVVSSLVSTISKAPPALERHVSHSTIDSYDDGETLTDIEHAECDMVKAFTKRWAENVKLSSTYWQGTRPIPYKERSVPTGQYFTLYKTEQAIRNVSAYLNIPAPLEVDLPQPRLCWDPVHVGLAECVESGSLEPPLPLQYPPQMKLESLRAEFNENIKNERKKVQTVEARPLAGAKRNAGNQQEAHTGRMRLAHGPSRLWLDITDFVTGDAVADDDCL